MSKISEEWIKSIDDLLSRRGVAIKQRPWASWGEWSKQSGPSRMDSPEASAIFDWYTRNYGAAPFAMGSQFTGAIYFDHEVWPIHVPIAYGRVSLDIIKMVDEMPTVVKDRMYRDAAALKNLIAVSADCIDYGFGFSDLVGKPLPNTLAMNFLVSANQELLTSVRVLLSSRPTQKAAEAARMATEMFLKSFLSHHAGTDEKTLRMKVGHDLDEALARCLAHDPKSSLHVLDGRLQNFPEIGERYTARHRDIGELWISYSLAQAAGACVVRSVTDRDIRQLIDVKWERRP